MFRIFLIAGGMMLTAVLLAAPAFGLRCGSDLVDEGDFKIEVLKACGEPLSREVIGTRETPYGGGELELLLEEWIVDNGNNYYRLLFEGNRLILIEWLGRND